MNEKLNTSLHSIGIAAVVGLTAWAVFTGDIDTRYLLTILIIIFIVIEILSLIAVSKIYPENHTQFKIGVIATLMILLGIKSMMPDFFVPLTVALFAINFLYNFYTHNKRRSGTFKRRKTSKYKL